MTPEDKLFLRDFFRAVAERALEPVDDCYVPLYGEGGVATDDPVELLARGIEWTPGQSVQLFSGFRGTGKSTELRRLRHRLRESGYLVVLCDMESFVNLSTPIDVSDFLMALMGAFSEALEDPGFLGKDVAHQSYWERLGAFLTRARVEMDELKVKPEAAGISGLEVKASLKSDPTFKELLQDRMAGHVGALVEDVQEYVRDACRKLKKAHGLATEIVLLVDSLERLRGTSANADEVHKSVETLFAGHADKLHLPALHVVYTVPPYLKVRYPNLGSLYSPGGLQILPSVKIRDDQGNPNPAAFDALERVVASRGDWRRLLGERSMLDELIGHSGGHLRDLLRLLAEVIRRASVLPVKPATVASAVSQVRSEFLPIANDDARWLARASASHSAALESSKRLAQLAWFLDTHMLLCYRNGEEWYDVHPLIAAHVRRQAAEQPGAAATVGAAEMPAVAETGDD